MGGWVGLRNWWMGGWLRGGWFEVKTKRGKMRCLLLPRKNRFFFIFMKSLHGTKNKKTVHVSLLVCVCV
jgi:hypothetical protein